MNELSIREFGYILESENISNINLDCCSVSKSAWSFLERFAYSNEKKDRFVRTASYNGRKALQVKNFVGVISTPDGTHIEILPKTSESNQNIEDARGLLFKLLSVVPELPFIETTDAELRLFDKPLIEPLIAIFLKKLANLVRRGIRKDYQRIEAEERFLKGQLQMALQISQHFPGDVSFSFSDDPGFRHGASRCRMGGFPRAGHVAGPPHPLSAGGLRGASDDGGLERRVPAARAPVESQTDRNASTSLGDAR